MARPGRLPKFMPAPVSGDPVAHVLSLAAARPSAIALFAPGQAALSFGELASRIGRMRSQLAAWGIGRGDVVAWVSPGRAESAAALSILPAASTLAPLNPCLGAEAYEALLKRLRPKAVASPAGVDHAIARAARDLGIAEIAVLPERSGAAGAFGLELFHPRASLDLSPVVAPEAVYVVATSGTTARPKLVPVGQRQIMATALAKGKILRHRAGRRRGACDAAASVGDPHRVSAGGAEWRRRCVSAGGGRRMRCSLPWNATRSPISVPLLPSCANCCAASNRARGCGRRGACVSCASRPGASIATRPTGSRPPSACPSSWASRRAKPGAPRSKRSRPPGAAPVRSGRRWRAKSGWSTSSVASSRPDRRRNSGARTAGLRRLSR